MPDGDPGLKAKLLKIIGLGLSIAGSILAAGCTSAKFALVNIPVWFSDVVVEADLVYSDSSGQMLDIYRSPALTDASSQTKPVLIFFHGGGWQTGNKNQYAYVGGRLAAAGYIVVLPNTRLYPEARFPVFVEDAAEAVAWVQRNIASFGGDSSAIVLIGHSSGAHMAGLLAADQRYLESAGADYSSIRGFAGLAGPYDFEPQAEIYKRVFSTVDNYDEMQVSTFIDGTEPPMLLAYGNEDKIVAPQNIERLSLALEAKGVSFETKRYDGLDHVDLAAAFSWLYADNSPVLADLLTFLADTLDTP